LPIGIEEITSKKLGRLPIEKEEKNNIFESKERVLYIIFFIYI
jgi:hypothetical protein